MRVAQIKIGATNLANWRNYLQNFKHTCTNILVFSYKELFHTLITNQNLSTSMIQFMNIYRTVTISLFISTGEGYILTRAALDRLIPLFQCLPHFEAEDTWITGFLCDYQNISRRWLPGSYNILSDESFRFGHSLDFSRPTLEILLGAFNNKTANISLHMIKSIAQNPENRSHPFVASNEWFEQQISQRALHVNSVHMKMTPHELRCLWKNGITSEQLYIDFMINGMKQFSETFQDLLQKHAERILPSIPVSIDELKDRARFRCIN